MDPTTCLCVLFEWDERHRGGLSRVCAANLTLDIRRPKHERLAPTRSPTTPSGPTGYVRMQVAHSPPLALRGSSLSSRVYGSWSFTSTCDTMVKGKHDKPDTIHTGSCGWG